MKRLVLVDLNNYGFAGMSAPILSSGERDTQAVFSVLKRTRSLYEEYPTATIAFLDDGRSWRKDIYPEYKANRVVTEKQLEVRNAYAEQKKIILEGLGYLGCLVVKADNLEADDLAAIMTNNAIKQGRIVTLMTADQDWQQLVQPGVSWIDIIRNKTCRHTTFQRDTGYKDTKQFVDAKCVLGDAGDNIKGINGIGPKKLEAWYKCFDTFAAGLNMLIDRPEMFHALWESKTGSKVPKVIRELDIKATADKLLDNYKLVDLNSISRPEPKNLKRKAVPLNMDAFEFFCAENSFLTISKNLSLFLEPFENNRPRG